MLKSVEQAIPHPSETSVPILMSCQLYYYACQGVHMQNLIWIDSAVVDLCMRKKTHFHMGFYRASSDRAVYAMPSVTSQYCIKMAEHRITQTAPHDSPGTLVFQCRRTCLNSKVTPTRVPNAGGVGKIGDFQQITCHVSETVQVE